MTEKSSVLFTPTLLMRWVCCIMVFTSIPAYASDPSAIDIRLELARHQFTPQHLTACGITANQVPTVLGYAIEQIDDRWNSIESSRETLESLKAQCEGLERRIRSGQASSGDVSEYNMLLIQLQAARDAYSTLYRALDQAMLAALNSEQHAQFVTMRVNGERGVSFKYRVLELDDDDWRSLRNALSSVRSYEDIEEEGDNPPPAAATQRVQQHQSSYLVNLVEARLNTHLDGVTSRFETVLGNLP